MRRFSFVFTIVFLGSLSSLLFCAPVPVAPSISVGGNLEAGIVVPFSQAAPDSGLEMTLTSSDPGRVRFAKQQDQPGSESLTLHVRPGFRASPEFWVQGLGNSGVVTYVVKAGDQESTGTVTLTPSAIVIIGPMKAPRFMTTTRSAPSTIRLSAVRLDADLKVAEEQFIAGGQSVRVDINNSKAGSGTLSPTYLEIPGGTNTAVTKFQPSGEGDATISPSVPRGFVAPREYASVTAAIRTPALAVPDELVIGQNLELRGILTLGAPAPSGGLKVTLNSDDPERLLISPSATAIGTKIITVTVPAGASMSPFYLQALRESGKVVYRAAGPGFRSGSATVTLAPSGVVLTPNFQGPPDEAQVLSKEPTDGTYRFSTALSKPAHVNLVAWTVQLDPVTHRSADITVQPLRGGLSLDIPLTNSNPAIGTVVQTISIAGGEEHSVTTFRPLTIGVTEIAVTTPKDFTVSANSTRVVANVVK